MIVQNRMRRLNRAMSLAVTLLLLCSTILPGGGVRASAPAATADADSAGSAWELPFVRLSHTAVYETWSQRVIVFGGYNGREFFNDVWALDVSVAGSESWTKLNPSGPWPPPRAQHTAIYDQINHRMIVFGGHSFHYNFDDVWALDLTTAGEERWTQLSPTGQPPSARRWHTAIYDSYQRLMLVFGGAGSSGLLNDLWELDLTLGAEAWSPVAVFGTVPAARAQHTAIYDIVNDLMVVFGGIAAGTPRSDTWTWNPATSQWAHLTPTGTPPARAGHTAVADVVGDYGMLVFGGRGASGFLDDLWKLTVSPGVIAWTELSPSASPDPPGVMPQGRAWHTAAFRPVNSALYVLGGRGMTTFGGQLQWNFNRGGMVWLQLAPALPEWWQGEAPMQSLALQAGSRPDVLLEIEDAPANTTVDVLSNSEVWFTVKLSSPVSTYASNVDVVLTLPTAKFETVQAATRHNDWDAISTWGTPASLGNGQYRFNDADLLKIGSEQDYSVQVVFKAHVKTTAAEGSTSLTADAFGDNWKAHLQDTASARVRRNPQVWFVTNRAGLFAQYDRTAVTRLLDEVYEQAQNSGRSTAILYADRYVPALATWNNTSVSYASETTANAVADDLAAWLANWTSNFTYAHPTYLAIVGDDNVVPFYRKHSYLADGILGDQTEDDHPDCWADEPVCEALVSHNFFMTDNPYGDWQFGTVRQDWEEGGLETAVGRIVGATAPDMRTFLKNAMLGPNPNETRALLVSDGLDWWLPGDNNDAQNVLGPALGYTMNESLIDNDAVNKAQVVDAMELGFAVMGAAHHGEVDYWEAPDGANGLWSFDLPDYDPNGKITANRPFFYFNSCRVGLSYTRDWGLGSPGAYDDSMVYALVHRGASGIIASSGLSYGIFTSNVAGDNETLANDFWVEARYSADVSDPLGWSLMQAKIDHPVGENVTAMKTVQTFTYFGVPWMRLPGHGTGLQATEADVPQSSDAWSTPRQVTGFEAALGATYSITAHVNASVYAISQTIEGFDTIEVDGLEQQLVDGELVRPGASLALMLPISATITTLVFTPTQALSLPDLDLPTVEMGVPIPGGPTGGYTTTVGGVYPVTVTVETRDLGTFRMARIDVIPVTYNATTDAATLYRGVDVAVTYDTPESVALTGITLNQPHFVPGEPITATAHLINAGGAAETVTATLVLQDPQGRIVGVKNSGGFSVPADGSYDLALGWVGTLDGNNYWLRLLIWKGGHVITGVGREIQVTNGELSELNTPTPAAPGRAGAFDVTFANLGASSTVAMASLLIHDGAGVPVAFVEPQTAAVAGGTSYTFTFAWTPDAPGTYVASAVVSAGGEEYGPLSEPFVVGATVFLPLVLRN